MKQSLQKSLMWAVVLSETSHVFCCVFPTIFSVIGLLAGLGVVAVMPPFMVSMHEMLHGWEVPMIVASGVILAIGWLAVWYSDRIDCHSTGCAHGACAPKKNRAHLVLKIATVLFVFNVFIFATVHKSNWLVDTVSSLTGASVAEDAHKGE